MTGKSDVNNGAKKWCPSEPEQSSRSLIDLPDSNDLSVCLQLGHVSAIAYHASPSPRLWPCSSSVARTPRAEISSAFGALGCCSTSVAVRWELSRLRL